MALQTSTSTKLTYEDYCLIPDDGKRHEIIDGELYVNPAPNTKHVRVCRNILFPLGLFVDDQDLGEVFYAPYDTVLSENDVVQPDILFISKSRLRLVTRANVQGAPDLVVEVLSPSNRNYDLTVKRKRYDLFGVAEYWIVDPEEEWLRIHRRSGKDLTVAAELRNDDVLTSPLLPGFSLPLEDIFAE